ncbi:MAG TPA: GNAT family N-acetyltransferase [Acidimicrobiia bacterium]
MNEVRDNRDRSRYELLVDGEVAGFVQYNMRGGRLLLVHTEVDEARAGHGLAGILVSGALDDVRRRRLCIVPVCPFVERYIERHPEYDDLVDHEMFDALNAEK